MNGPSRALLALASAVHGGQREWRDAWEESARAAIREAGERHGPVGEVRAAARELRDAITERVRAGTLAARDWVNHDDGWGTMMGHDVRHAVRMLFRSRGITAMALVTLALGIGAVTAVFSVVDGVLLNPLAYAEPERVVMVGETDPAGNFRAVSWENYRDWREADLFEAVALYAGNSVTVAGEGTPERIRGMFVTSSYFDVVGVRPVLGRAIAPGEDEPGDPRTVVLSWGWWQERFGGDPDVLGRTVRLNNEPHTIVGVMPKDFRSPFDIPSAWISFQTLPRELDRASRNVTALALLRPGDDPASAAAALERTASELAARYPDTNQGWSGWALLASTIVTGPQRPLLLGLLASVGVLLLIAAANVAGLQVARIEARTREMAVRSALGGSRVRLVRQLLVENGVLTLLGGLAGLAVAWIGVDALVALDPSMEFQFDVRPDLRVLAAGLGVTVLTALLTGLLPAVSVARSELGGVLSEGGRGGGPGRKGQRLRSGLVVLQIALSLSLLVSAGLLVRSLEALGRVDLGFETENLLTLEFRLPANRYDTEQAMVAFFDEALTRVRAIPGVETAATAQNLPFADRGRMPFILEGTEPDLDRAPQVDFSRVTPAFRETLGLALVQGRDLDPGVGPDAPMEALVSETVALELLAGRDPVGAAFYFNEELEAATIVGVVSDISFALREGRVPTVYLNQRQDPAAFASMVVRTRGEPMLLADPVRRAVWAVDPDQAVWEVMPLSDRIRSSAGSLGFGMALISFFGIVAALLAAVGIYGVMAYTVGVRTREMGLRMALGADRRSVLVLVMRQALMLVALGVAGGLILAWWSGALLESLLFGVSARDPATVGGAVLILAGVGLLAAWLPARRAAGVDPARILGEM